MWVQRLQQSKLFISFLVALVLVFSYEVSKPKAVAPLLWAGSLIAGAVVEEAVEMGIRHFTDTGKTKTKSKTKKIADEILGNPAGYDFPTQKPIRKADGSLELPMSPNDRAKIARKIADEFDDVIEADEARRATKPDYAVYDDLPDDMFAYSSVSVLFKPYNAGNVGMVKGTDMLSKLYHVHFKPNAYEKSTDVTLISSVDGSSTYFSGVNGGAKSSPSLLTISGYIMSESAYTLDVYGSPNENNPSDYSSPITVKYYLDYLKAMEVWGSALYVADGISVPGTLRNVYRAGEGMPDDYQLPNYGDLSKKKTSIPDLFPATSTDTEMTWGELELEYNNNKATFDQKFESEIETYIADGDYNNNTYNTQIVNNYYTDTNYPVKNDEIANVIDIDIEIVNPPATGDDGDDLPTGTRPDPVEVLDRSVLDVMVKSYDFFDDAIDATVVSMKSVVDGAGGIVTFLDESMDWLPSEWRAVFVSTFLLGVFAHFFRR